jgi:hypothetical protein
MRLSLAVARKIAVFPSLVFQHPTISASHRQTAAINVLR